MTHSKPRLLDLFCGEGGAGHGYELAGFDVVGVDLDGARLAHTPYETLRADALDVLADLDYVRSFDAVHASPPCQRYSRGNAANDVRSLPDLIGPVRAALQAAGRPYVIENVEGAASELVAPLTLCGTEFALTARDDDGVELHMRRHRLFESSVWLMGAGGCFHPRGIQWAGSYGGARRCKVEARTVRKGGYVPTVQVQRRLLGAPWMTETGCHLSIPPAYTLHVGSQLLAQLPARV